MRRHRPTLVASLIFGAVLFTGVGIRLSQHRLELGRSAEAAPFASAQPYPQAAYGAVAVLNTATAVPAAASSINGREGIAISNLGAATIYCGGDSSVTTSNGFPVPVNGSVTMALSYNKAPQNGVVVYCIAAVSQVSPADTRWLEIY